MTPAAPVTLETIAGSIADLTDIVCDLANFMSDELLSLNTSLGGKIDSEIGLLRTEMRQEFKDVRTDMADMSRRITRLEKRVGSLEGEVKANSNDIQELYFMAING